jgi:DNA-binding transcriptional regulator YiaG
MSTKKDDLDTKSCYGLNEAMSPEQCRAARAWLGWSQQYLAKQASVGLSTVKDFENGSRKPIANNLNALRGALENERVRFDNPMGIRIDGKPPKP